MIYCSQRDSRFSTVSRKIGESDVLKRVWFYVEQVAPIDTTVLILGETGAGKEAAEVQLCDGLN